MLTYAILGAPLVLLVLVVVLALLAFRSKNKQADRLRDLVNTAYAEAMDYKQRWQDAQAAALQEIGRLTLRLVDVEEERDSAQRASDTAWDEVKRFSQLHTDEVNAHEAAVAEHEITRSALALVDGQRAEAVVLAKELGERVQQLDKQLSEREQERVRLYEQRAQGRAAEEQLRITHELLKKLAWLTDYVETPQPGTYRLSADAERLYTYHLRRNEPSAATTTL